jgi:hypothetical protein
MVKRCKYLIAGLLLCGALVGTAGASPVAHAGGFVPARTLPCQVCARVHLNLLPRPAIDSARVDGPYPDLSYRAIVDGSNFTPSGEVIADVYDTATNTWVGDDFDFADGSGHVNMTVWLPLTGGCYWNVQVGQWDPLAIQLDDLSSGQRTALVQVVDCVPFGNDNVGVPASN